jgi:hypothetical protein
MKHKISASSLFTREYLVVHDKGVKYCGTSLLRSVRRFRFDEICCVLMAPDYTLSFQVGEEVFSIRTYPASAKHRAAIAALLERVQASCPSPAVPAAQPI